MDSRSDPLREDDLYNHGRKIIMHPLYLPKISPWLDLKIFYVRISNCEIDSSTPKHLTLNYIPLTPDTVLEVNGRRSGIHSESVSSVLRRDRIDKRSEEATYVTTDSISVTGSVRFEVCAGGDMLVSGVLELSKVNGVLKEDKVTIKQWRMKCEPAMQCGQGHGLGAVLPKVEVYVAGCFSGIPIILTKTLHVRAQQKLETKKVMLDAIPEDETPEQKKEVLSKNTLQLSEKDDFTHEYDADVDYKSIYPRAEYFDGEDGELTWFNAGVRVGVGLGLGICLGVGLGVGLLARTYQSTTKSFKRRLF